MLGLLVLAGCGFHFRQPPDLPPSMRRIYVAAPSSTGDLLRELRRDLASNDTQVLETPDGASTILSIIGISHTSRPLALSRDGRPLEYRVSYEVEFSLQVLGATILEPQSVILERNYTYSVSNGIANEEQEKTLDVAISKDIAEFIVYRLIAASHSLPPSLVALPATLPPPAAAAAPIPATHPAPAAAGVPAPMAATMRAPTAATHAPPV
jgi:LPS-assembly lipoprotein